MLNKAILGGIFSFIFAGILAAHDLYLYPDAFYLDNPGQIIVEMQLTEDRFPGQALNWRADKTVQLKAIGPSGNESVPDSEGQNPEILLKKNGTHQIGWQAEVTYISIEPKIFEEYITIEGYKDAIETHKNKKDAYGRERYSRFIKTYVQVGKAATEHYKTPLGFKIEILPQRNPVNLKVGDELKVQVLFEGKPLAKNRVMSTYDKYSTMPEDYAQTVETDIDGIVRIKITHPGLWLVRSNKMVPIQGDPKADWESFWSNITFLVR